MKLIKVLWVDDRIDEFISLNFNKELKDYIDASFFESEIDMCESAEEAKAKLREKKYDVIFSDYNMSEEKGDSFIQDIRSQNINCEILFYSAQEEPPLVQADRISFLRLQSNRAYNELMNKIKSVIDLSLEKINDLTSIRGLVMAEVSDLDNKMLDIIEYFFKDGSDEKRRDFDKHIVKDVEKTTKQNLAKDECLKLLNESSKKKIESTPCKHKWRDIPINEIIHKKNFESVQKAKTVQLIIEKLEFSYFPKKNNFYEDYFNDIIENRNELAHCSSFIESGIEILKTKDGERKFSKEDFTLIRSSIIKYNTIFDKLIELVK